MLSKFYLDKEKDLIVTIYNKNKEEVTYLLETPNHNTGNLISNLAKLCGLETTQNKEGKKVIEGSIPASINGDNEIVYILRLGGIKIANIYESGKLEIKAKIPAITKTLMSQTKEYSLPIQKTIVKSYILKKSKFRTDLHTHMNANLSPDVLIALGIKHQLKYPLYYIKKLNLKLSEKQEEKIQEQRKKIEQQFENSELTGKYRTRKIDDNTFINFADLILNNPKWANYNIAKIRNSLAILKDGQAVFTNLEKLYIYRYVFCKGKPSEEKIDLTIQKIDTIPEKDIKMMVKMMLEDRKKQELKNISLRQDKLVWIAREYQKQGIQYVEIADTDLVKANGPAISFIEEIHEIMPYIEKETGVKIRFLGAMRRIPLTIIKDQMEEGNYLRENLDVLKAVAKSPYVVGSDFIGEEINDIEELKPAIHELVQYVGEMDQDFTIRIHAGENDSLKDNVAKSIECVKEALKPGQKMPQVRLGHGLYTADLNQAEGKELMQVMKENGIIVEFQLTSNVRLNNLSSLENHPLKIYLENGVKCVQGTDGCGFYGVDTIDEQLALQNLLNLTDEDFQKMREVEEEKIKRSEKYFLKKQKEWEKFLKGRTIKEAVSELEKENHEKNKNNKMNMRIHYNIESKEILKEKIKQLPENKIPIIIAGGSFNQKGRKTEVTKEGRKILEKLIQNIDHKKAYFVIGHKMQGYEKEIIEISRKANKNFEIDAIIPKRISKEESQNLQDEQLDGIRISIENDEMGIYKSFNYEIFERRNSVVMAFDGNWSVSNLVQEAKNGKGKAKIYVNEENSILSDKAKTLGGYVIPFNMKQNIVDQILKDNPEIVSFKHGS
ncbi:MAG: adenosine deaminase [Clostridia bacterium]|nr:adenosine deaminase [Clostridia bacterium]